MKRANVSWIQIIVRENKIERLFSNVAATKRDEEREKSNEGNPPLVLRQQPFTFRKKDRRDFSAVVAPGNR